MKKFKNWLRKKILSFLQITDKEFAEKVSKAIMKNLKMQGIFIE